MRIPHTLILLSTLACNNAATYDEAGADLIGESDRPAWDPDPQTISNSSSSSNVSWTPPDEEESPEPHHYSVVVKSEFDNVVFQEDVRGTSVELKGLRTDTEYNIDITACLDEACESVIIGEPMVEPVWRTEVENWVFPEVNGEELNPLISNASSPTLMNLSDLPNNQSGEEGWVLTTLQNDGWSKQISVSTLREIFFDDDSNMIDFAFETPANVGVQDVPNVIDFTSTSARHIEVDGEWKLQLFVSLSANIAGERSMIGSWTSDTGVSSIDLYEPYGGTCEFESLDNTCGMNTCMDSESDNGQTLASMDCIALIPNTDGFMMIQGRADSYDNSPTNLYIAKSIGNGEWGTMGNDGQAVTPLLKDAFGATVHVEDGLGKLYYWDANSNSAYIRYWDPKLSGSEDKLELADLESDDRVRNIYYTDRNGDFMTPGTFKVVERTFISKNNKEIMLATVETDSGDRHITFGVLQNP